VYYIRKMTQLFKKSPDTLLFNKVLQTLGIDQFKEEFCFRKKDLLLMGTVIKMKLLEPELREYYYPCKSKLYLDNINDSKCVTIIRQFLRFFDYQLVSKEKYDGGEKYIMYSLSASHHIKSPKMKTLQFNV
jgi:hypothetical protein